MLLTALGNRRINRSACLEQIFIHSISLTVVLLEKCMRTLTVDLKVRKMGAFLSQEQIKFLNEIMFRGKISAFMAGQINVLQE